MPVIPILKIITPKKMLGLLTRTRVCQVRRYKIVDIYLEIFRRATHATTQDPSVKSVKSVIQFVTELPLNISKLLNQINNSIAPEVIRQIGDRTTETSMTRRNRRQQPKNPLIIHRIRSSVQLIHPFSRHRSKQ